MTPCFASLDECRYQRGLDAWDRDEDAKWAEAKAVAASWEIEFLATGRIDEIDFDLAEIEAEMKERNLPTRRVLLETLVYEGLG